MKTKKKLLAILFFTLYFSVITSNFLNAQNLLNYYNIKFHKLTNDNGLPDNNVTKIVQDSKGLIWLTTPNGFVRFDGIKTKVYQNKPNDSTSLPNNLVRNVVIAQNDVFYIATDIGLVKFYPQLERFEYMCTDKYPDLKNLNNAITGFTSISNQRIVIEMNTIGFIIFDTKTDEVITIINNENYGELGWPKINPTFQLEDKDGYLWFTSGEYGFYKIKIDGRKVQIKNYFGNINSKIEKTANATIVYENDKGDIYFANNGLYILPYEKKETSEFRFIDIYNRKQPASNIDFNINDIIEDQKKNIWLATENYGVKKYNPKTNKIETISYKPCNFKGETSTTARFWKDKQQQIWLMYKNSVFARYNYSSNVFSEYKYDPTNPDSPFESFNFKNISSSFQDKSGVYWLISNNYGLMFFDLKKAKFPILKDLHIPNYSISANTAWGIYEDTPHKRLWLGTNDASLNIIDLKTGRVTIDRTIQKVIFLSHLYFHFPKMSFG